MTTGTTTEATADALMTEVPGIDTSRMPEPLALVIFGASGDLATRKLLPALARHAENGALPRGFAVVGVARSGIGDEGFRDLCAKVEGAEDNAAWQQVIRKFRYVAGDYSDPATFERLAAVLAEVDVEPGAAGNRVYYLATVPDLFGTVARGLAAYKANEPGPGGSFARLVVEKPFGADLDSSRALDDELHQSFDEDQIFRIDHYMGKETVQNVLALRFANAIFEPIWNRRYVDHVQVTVAESIGVEHRGNFYERAGALRDIVQNHVMQVLALTLMEPPASLNGNSIRDEKVKLLRSVVVHEAEQEIDRVVRAQYVAGEVGGVAVPGYREEDGVDPASLTETYLAMQLAVDNWRWAGVPVFVRTGKRLRQRETQVAMVFQRPPHLPFAGQLTRDLLPDALTLRIQPDEGITLCFGAKVPGPSFTIRTVAMDFSYSDAFPGGTAEAYERLLLDAMTGDPMLFIRTDEVEQAWQIVAPIQRAFTEGEPPLARYRAGSWGPAEADRLIEASGRMWRNP